METIRALQVQGHAVFFTIDAGPQVKAVCLPESADVAKRALQQTPGVISTMQSSLGQGAATLEPV
jgi:diphosphomevalonate decarboxylase